MQASGDLKSRGSLFDTKTSPRPTVEFQRPRPQLDPATKLWHGNGLGHYNYEVSHEVHTIEIAMTKTRVFGSIWKYRMQWFSWRTCTVRAAGANVECRRHELPGGSEAMPPWEICKIGLSKMQFPAFPGPELGNLEGLLRPWKPCSQEINIWLIWQL